MKFLKILNCVLTLSLLIAGINLVIILIKINILLSLIILSLILIFIIIIISYYINNKSSNLNKSTTLDNKKNLIEIPSGVYDSMPIKDILGNEMKLMYVNRIDEYYDAIYGEHTSRHDVKYLPKLNEDYIKKYLIA